MSGLQEAPIVLEVALAAGIAVALLISSILLVELWRMFASRWRERCSLQVQRSLESLRSAAPGSLDLRNPLLRGDLRLLASLAAMLDAGGVEIETIPLEMKEEIRAGLVRRLSSEMDSLHGSGSWRKRRSHRRLAKSLGVLGKLPSEANVPLLIQALMVPSEPVLVRAASVVAADTDRHAGVFISLVEALGNAGRLGRPFLERALQDLAADNAQMMPLIVGASSVDVRRVILTAAGNALERREARRRPSEIHESLWPIIEAGATDAEGELRTAACRVLGVCTGDRALRHLRTLLSDELMAVQVAAARALSTRGGSGAILALCERLESAEPPIDAEIRSAVSSLNPPRPTRDLVRRIKRGSLVQRVAGLRVLGLLQEVGAVSHIAALLTDRSPTLRGEAALALADIGRQRSMPLRGHPVVDELAQRLRSEKHERTAAGFAAALASTGDERAAGGLMARIGESSAILREQLIESLAFLDQLMTAASGFRGRDAEDRLP